jgi:hypothetical protein
MTHRVQFATNLNEVKFQERDLTDQEVFDMMVFEGNLPSNPDNTTIVQEARIKEWILAIEEIISYMIERKDSRAIQMETFMWHLQGKRVPRKYKKVLNAVFC